MEQACSFSPFCLGMCDWTDCPGSRERLEISTHNVIDSSNGMATPPTSTNELNAHASGASAIANTRAPPTIERFREFIDDGELVELGKGLIPANTSLRCTKWALKTFELWRNARNERFPDDSVPEDLLMSTDPSLLNTHLTQFIVEARKANREYYPPSSLHQLLCGILRHMRETNPHCPNFLDKKDARFQQLHRSLDVHFNKLHSNGIGRQVKHAEIISKNDEQRLWESGLMGVSDPRALQNAVFYAVGKMFCLRGGVEHRALKLSQLQRKTDPGHYIYTENVSKNRNGSFKQLHVQSKTVPIYACPEAGMKCPVHLLDLYISKLPSKAVEKDIFYARPLETVPADPSAPWYTATPVGKHTLNDKVKKCASQPKFKEIKLIIALGLLELRRCIQVVYQKKLSKSGPATDH